MLNGTEIYELCGPSVANLVFSRSGQRVSSGTGFVVGNHLVTAGHVVHSARGLDFDVVFEKSSRSVPTRWADCSSAPTIGGFSDEHSYDYAIVVPPDEISLPPSLEWATECPVPGTPVCALGYPFEDPHLTLHQGFVSAVYQSGPALILKIDMSINPSNSGGPLISMKDGKVVGMVTRKATGLTKAFDQLVSVMDENIRFLTKPRQIFASIGGIDPVQAALVSQTQIRHVAAEIYRSANVGIGYAVWNEPLKHEPRLSEH